jgi:hypothetical protein
MFFNGKPDRMGEVRPGSSLSMTWSWSKNSSKPASRWPRDFHTTRRARQGREPYNDKSRSGDEGKLSFWLHDVQVLCSEDHAGRSTLWSKAAEQVETVRLASFLQSLLTALIRSKDLWSLLIAENCLKR